MKKSKPSRLAFKVTRRGILGSAAWGGDIYTYGRAYYKGAKSYKKRKR